MHIQGEKKKKEVFTLVSGEWHSIIPGLFSLSQNLFKKRKFSFAV